MNKYVYIRYEEPDWRGLQRYRANNRNLDQLIGYVALKYYHDCKCTGKAKRLIVSEANTLLRLKLMSENVDEDKLKVYAKVSLKQISSLRRTISGYTTCYATIILMAIFNLLADGPDPDVSFKVQSLCNEDVHFLAFCLKEQYTNLIQAIQGGEGEFGNINTHQYLLANYYNATCVKFEHHLPVHTYKYVMEHLNPQEIFRYQEDLPNYRDMNLVM